MKNMNKKLILAIFVFACSIGTSAVVLSTFSGASNNPAVEQQIVICKIIVLAMTFVLVLIADNALVKDARSAVKQFQRKNVANILKEGTFKAGRYLNISGIVITFSCLTNQMLSILQTIPLSWSITVMVIGAILYIVGASLILLAGPSAFEEDMTAQ